MHPLMVESAAKTETKVDLNYCDENVRVAKLQVKNFLTKTNYSFVKLCSNNSNN